MECSGPWEIPKRGLLWLMLGHFGPLRHPPNPTQDSSGPEHTIRPCLGLRGSNFRGRLSRVQPSTFGNFHPSEWPKRTPGPKVLAPSPRFGPILGCLGHTDIE